MNYLRNKRSQISYIINNQNEDDKESIIVFYVNCKYRLNYYSNILNKAMTPTQQVVEEPKKAGRPPKTEKVGEVNG